MKDWPDNCVDLVLTDPPYGIRITHKANQYGNSTHLSRKANHDKWDNLPMSPLQWEKTKQVSVEQIVFGANYFWQYFRQAKCYIVWDKRGSLPDVPFLPMELAWTSYDKMPKKYTVINHGFITDIKEQKRLHPTQKPLLLMQKIVIDFTQPNDLILDPFCGSGTTCVAAKMLGRRYIGIDISEKYCEIARQRLEAVDTGVPIKEQKAGQLALFKE
jgi:site-specific DNA-methyltransferase (adenine-specific)